jgi:hypothetical protein
MEEPVDCSSNMMATTYPRLENSSKFMAAVGAETRDEQDDYADKAALSAS